MAPSLSIEWQRIIVSNTIRRSSQVIAVGDDKVHIFGGEIIPREPVDSNIYSIPMSGEAPNKTSIATQPVDPTSPTPRVGSAITTINETAYLFSGRGGIAMAPVEERGLIHSLHLPSQTWMPLTPANDSSPFPPARSYHSLTSNGSDTLYLHAGCPETGRLSDLWSFHLQSHVWTQLASAPDPPRGGTSIAFADGKLYRLGGFDGKHELGGSMDVYSPKDDLWSTFHFEGTGPEARSVAGLVATEVAGREVLLSLFGERNPSSLGHAGAGKMLGDVWGYDVQSRQWVNVVQEGGGKPAPRGWFAVSVVEAGKIVVQGGLAEDNSRLGDVWVGTVKVDRN